MTELGINQIPQTWEELEMLVRQVAAYNAAHDTSYAVHRTGRKDNISGEMHDE